MAWHGMAGPVHAPAWALLCCHCRLPLDWQCRWPSAGTEQQGTRSCDEPPSPIGLFSSTHGAPRLPHQHGQSCTARHARQEQACESIAPAVIFCQPHPRPISSAHVKPDFFFHPPPDSRANRIASSTCTDTANHLPIHPREWSRWQPTGQNAASHNRRNPIASRERLRAISGCRQASH